MRTIAAATDWRYLIPNGLSAARVGLAAWLPFAHPDWWPAMIIGAGITDLLDGLIARRCNLQSWIGGHLDAVADKGFFLVALVTLTAWGALLPWQLLVLLSRDLAVLFISLYAAGTRKWHAFRHMPARWLGKLATSLIFAMMIAITMDWALFGQLLFWLAGVSSIAAAADYFAEFIRKRREDRSSGPLPPEVSGLA